MSRTFSRDGRFFIEYTARNRDSHLYSESSYSWQVCRASDDREIAAFSGSWDQAADKDERSGTSSVSFSEDGRELIIENFDGTRERRALPAKTKKERRASEHRANDWEKLWKAPGAESAPLNWGSPARLFGREIRLQFSMSDQYPLPGGGVAWGVMVTLVVGGESVKIPAGPHVRECNGLRIAIRVDEGAALSAVASEIAPAGRPPRGRAR